MSEAGQLFNAFIKKHFPDGDAGRWAVAVSGGVDSVVLAHLCKAAGIECILLHCNFGLRGAESDRDQHAVEALADALAFELYINKFDTKAYVAEHGVSIQVAARELRYTWFEKMRVSHACRFIATAHHADDNVETVLMNLFRGSGIRGLRGIVPVQQTIIRPLLGIAKEAIVAYAVQHALQWVEDSSNATDKYSRNYIRHHILPLMKAVYPEAGNNFLQSIANMQQAEILYGQAVDLHIKKLLVNKNNEVHIPVLKLKKTVPLQAVIYEIIKPYHFSSNDVAAVETLMNSETGRFISSSSHRIIKNRNWLIIAPLAAEQTEHVVIEAGQSSVLFQHGLLDIKLTAAKQEDIPADANTALLDAKLIRFPMLLRPWKTGDYFYPLGMPKKKKLARFFIDQKLSKTQKEKVWVIESDKRIVWVVGLRIDDRCKMLPSTKQVVQIRFTPA